MAANSYNAFMPRVGERKEVMISHAEYDKENQLYVLWGQFHLSEVEKIEDALTELQDLAQRKEHPRGQLRPGDLCLAKSIQDNQWHRASIQTATGNDVLAFYVDYGSTEFVPRSRIRTLDKDLALNFEAQATKLILRGIQPIFIRGGIKTGTLDYLDRYVVNKVFVCEPMEHHREAVFVKLYALNGKRDVSAQFITDGFAEPASHQALPSPTSVVPEIEFKELPVMGLDVGQRERVYVTHVTTPTQFWIQQEVVSVDLDDMMSDMQTFFAGVRGPERVSHAVPNLPCVTKYNEDNQFYRCQVLRSTGLQSCEVFFVDYGNSAEAEVSALYHLPDQFAKLPGAAIEAGLSGLDPKSCSSVVSTTRFEDLVMEKILCVKVDSIEGPKLMVSMVDPRSDLNLSITEILVKEKLASRVMARRPHGPPNDGLPPPNRTSSRSSSSSQPSPKGQPPAAKMRHPSLKEGSRYPVTITDISSSNDFACQLLADSPQFEKMSALLQDDYASRGPKDSKMADIQVGSVCCAQFSEDSMWYRAEVTSIKESSSEVYFVDYGNKDVLPFGKLKQLDQKYLEMEAQSVRCKLENVDEVPRYSDKMKAKFEELVGENELEARICQSQRDLFVVELVDKASRLNINEEMRRFGSSLRPQRATRGSVSDEFVKLEPARRDKMKVYVSNVESPNLFHCQPVSSAEELQKLMDTLNDPGFQSSPTSPFQPKLQAPCMAQYSDDQVWYRAVITGTKRSGDFEVRFVDFGNHETVSPGAIKPLQSKFMSFPMQGIPCSLEGLAFKPWTDEEINRFSDMCGDSELEVEFSSRVGENYEVRLRTETGICINDVFKPPAQVNSSNERVSPGRSHRDHAPPKEAEIHQFIERDMDVGPNVPVYISHVENLSEVWCQPASTTKDLESLMLKLDQKYNKLKPDQMAIKKPRLGMACVAQFQEDKNWYRAIIINKQLKRVYVCFVDYGNFEYVPVSCIKEIDNDIMKVPTVAVKCSLRGSKDLEGPLRVQKLRSLIDEVECFTCKVISSENGVFEVDITYDGGKSVTDLLKSVPKEEAAPPHLQTPPRGQRSGSPRSPTSTRPETSRGRSPPRDQRTFESKPQRRDIPPPAEARQSTKDDWGETPSVPRPVSAPASKPATSLPTTTPATAPPATKPVPKPHPVRVIRHIKRQEELVPLGEHLDVVVSFLESPAKFWLQQASICPEIDAMMETLADGVSSGKLQAIKELERGQLCIAQSVTDEAHYRARVTKTVGDQVEVYYIDYGNKEMVPPSSLFSITPDLLKLPAQAIQASLRGLSRTSIFTEDIIDQFTEATMEKQLLANPTKKLINYLEIDLVDTTTDEDINISDMMKKVVGESQTTSLPLPEINETESVYVTQVEEDGSFFIQLSSSTEALEQVHADIQSAYTGEVAAVGEAKPGQLCCGLYSADNEWYRGVVETVQESGDASVRFLDYGNASLCKVSELKVLLPQFLDKPALAIKCELNDVHLTGVVEIGIALEEMTLEKELTCKFHEKDMPCQVSLSENDVSINEVLKKKFDYQPVEEVETVSQPGIDWVFQTVELGKKFEAYVSSVVSPGYFFVQPSSVTKELEDLMVEMQSTYSQRSTESLLSAGDISTGTLCAALYAEDNLWYRGEILQQDGDQVTVLFPDYGNSDIVSKKNLKVLKKKHSDLTLKAIGCCLNGAFPTSGTWSLQSGEFFEAETMDKALLVEVVDIGAACRQAGKVIHGVKLLDMGMSVADKLIQAGHASDGAAPATEGQPAGQVIAELKIAEAQTFSGYPSYHLEAGTAEGIFITAVTSLTDFCIQLARHADEVAEFGNKVDEHYKANEVPSISDAKVGMPCVAQYTEDEVWYRAVVVEATGENAYVTFVDYGNGDTVPVASIRELKEDFAKRPAYAFRCRMGGIDEEKSTDEKKVGKFEELMEKETLTAKVLGAREGIIDVQVLDEGVTVTKTLELEEDLTGYQVTTAGASSEAAPVREGVTSTTMYPGYTTKLLPIGAVKPVFLTSVTAFSELCVQLGSDADAVANFTAELDEFYKGNEVPSIESVEVGTVCAAQFTDDEVWYRALVTSLEEDKADVLFVDYGNSDTLAKTSLKVLGEKYLEMPTFALKCCLAGVDQSADENEEALDKLQEFLESESLQARVVESADAILSIQLLDNGKSVAEAVGLVETLKAPSQVIPYTPYEIQPGTTENVYLTSVSSLKDFAIQLQKFEDAVAEFNAKLDEFYKGNQNPAIGAAVPGMRCVGKFSDDEVWYRGVVEHLEGTATEVTFVDYGNNDLIETSELKELHADFSEQHTFSFQCRLAGVMDEGGEDVVTKFEAYMESESLAAKVIRVDDDGRLVVQLLDGEDSVAIKLGLEEDLTSETETADGLDTTAHSLVEDALSSAMKDIELEDSSTEGAAGEGQPNEEPIKQEEDSPEDPEKLATEEHQGGEIGDTDAIAGALIKEVVESACKELGELALNDDKEDEKLPSVVTPELSPPREPVSPPDGSTQDEDEFEDAETSPKRDGTTTEMDTVLQASNNNKKEAPSDDESFEDAVDESRAAEEGSELIADGSEEVKGDSEVIGDPGSIENNDPVTEKVKEGSEVVEDPASIENEGSVSEEVEDSERNGEERREATAISAGDSLTEGGSQALESGEGQETLELESEAVGELTNAPAGHVDEGVDKTIDENVQETLKETVTDGVETDEFKSKELDGKVPSEEETKCDQEVVAEDDKTCVENGLCADGEVDEKGDSVQVEAENDPAHEEDNQQDTEKDLSEVLLDKGVTLSEGGDKDSGEKSKDASQEADQSGTQETAAE